MIKNIKNEAFCAKRVSFNDGRPEALKTRRERPGEKETEALASSLKKSCRRRKDFE